MRARSSGPKNQVWAALALVGIVVDDTPVVSANIVQSLDWVARGGFERATLLRIRGWLSFTPPVAVPSTIFWCVGRVDNGVGVAALDPTLVATYVNEDILATGGQAVAVTAAANDLIVPNVDVDIKAMRKISVADEIRLAMRTTGPAAAGWTVNGVLRALVRIGGN